MADADWKKVVVDNGIAQVDLPSWRHYYRFVSVNLLKYDYIYRGQTDFTWKLESSLDRLAKRHPRGDRKEHLGLFKYATQGRRGQNPRRPEGENEWWALGQHFGLATPLLDWTTSPFVAAYFAYIEPTDVDERPGRRAVWALARGYVRDRSRQLEQSYRGRKRPPIIEFVRPLSDENARLISQSGLFTRAPDGKSIDEWVGTNFEGETLQVLWKITLPSDDRNKALRDLNGMNVNHMTLFPDLYGSAKFCNTAFQVPSYEISPDEG